MKYILNDGTHINLTVKRNYTDVNAWRRHGNDGLVYTDIMQGFSIVNDIGIDLTMYETSGGYWFILDAISGIAVCQGFGKRKTVNRFIDFINKNGKQKAVEMIERGREEIRNKFAKYVAV